MGEKMNTYEESLGLECLEYIKKEKVGKKNIKEKILKEIIKKEKKHVS